MLLVYTKGRGGTPIVRAELAMNVPLRNDADGKFITYTWRHGERWFVTRTGPGFVLLYVVIEYTTEGEEWLKSLHDPFHDTETL